MPQAAIKTGVVDFILLLEMNEELQSTNEELQTINEELRQRSEELDRVNTFLESILTSTARRK